MRKTSISAYVAALREKVGNRLLLLPSAAAAVFDDDRKVLLVHHQEGKWVLPGGAIDPLEQPADAVVREVWEETGLVVEPYAIIGTYGGASHHVIYANGDEVSYVSTVFACRPTGGSLRPDGVETLDVGFFAQKEYETLPLSRIARTVLPDAFAFGGTARFEPPSRMPTESSGDAG